MGRARGPSWVPGPGAAGGGWHRSPAYRRQRQPYSTPMQQFTRRVSVPLRQQGSTTVDANGNATVIMAPQGAGTRWYVSHIQVRTDSGSTDLSNAVVYRDAQLAGHEIARTDQGGSDTMGCAVPGIQPGDLLIIVWAGANTGDIASATIYGDQSVLM